MKNITAEEMSKEGTGKKKYEKPVARIVPFSELSRQQMLAIMPENQIHDPDALTDDEIRVKFIESLRTMSV